MGLKTQLASERMTVMRSSCLSRGNKRNVCWFFFLFFYGIVREAVRNRNAIAFSSGFLNMDIVNSRSPLLRIQNYHSFFLFFVFLSWNMTKCSFVCLAYCHEFFLSSFCMCNSFNLFFSRPSSTYSDICNVNSESDFICDFMICVSP